jgi:carbamoyl-phosphate synthase small subunit
MSGYQESLTDPAYKGQILVSSFPLAGDYGVNERFDSSDRVHASAFVVREYNNEPSDMYGGRTLGDLLKKNKIPGIFGIDTRDLVTMIRSSGTMKGAIVFDKKDVAGAKKKFKERTGGENPVGLVSTKKIMKIGNKGKATVGVIDCGADRGLINDMSELYDVIVFPYDTKAEEIRKHKVKALVVSNGPGDPAHPDIVKTVVKTIKDLYSAVPIIGLSLGAQTVALAFGCKTYKMKHGHHGCNQPVKHGIRVRITAQNHLYSVDPDSLKGTGLIIDQVNVNDGTPEGFSHEKLPVYGMQYYPAPLRYEEDSIFYGILKKVTGAGK